MPTINWSEINWIAVAVAAFATFMIGGVWYSALFTKAWVKAHRFTDDDVKKAQAEGSMLRFFGGMILSYALVALGMAVLVQWSGIHSLTGGLSLGGVLWLTIVAPITYTNHLPSMVKPAGFAIDASYELIYCLLTGAILGAWQ